MEAGPLPITVQYLEGSAAHARQVSFLEARERLQAILKRLPLGRVLLGWNLPEAVVETCAAECQRRAIELYLWHPLLAGDGNFIPQPDWSTIGLSGTPVPGHGGLAEFTFICPNHREARAAALDHLDRVLASGYFQGVFLDRMRFPSPASNPMRDLACFCPNCQRAAEQEGMDLLQIQSKLRAGLAQPVNRVALVAGLLASPGLAAKPDDDLIRLVRFRMESIRGMVTAAMTAARRLGLKVGLDCFSPTLAVMVGQDLTTLSPLADWVKVMTYLRAYGPATIPFELSGLARWLMAGGLSETGALNNLAKASGWSLPGNIANLRYGGLDNSILTSEICQARAKTSGELLAGIELVEMAGISELNESQIRADLAVLADSDIDGLALSWDGWSIPLERLELVGAVLG